LKKERPDDDPVLATVIRRGQRLHRGEPDLAGIRNRAAAWLAAPLRRLGTYVHPAVIGEALQKLAEQLDRAPASTGGLIAWRL